MTTRFPLCTVVMELAAKAEACGVRVEAEWTPRDRNQEADDPSNLRTNGFDPHKEVKFDLKGQRWLGSGAEIPGAEGFGSSTEEERGETREKEEEEEERREAKVQREMAKDVWQVGGAKRK